MEGDAFSIGGQGRGADAAWFDFPSAADNLPGFVRLFR